MGRDKATLPFNGTSSGTTLSATPHSGAGATTMVEHVVDIVRARCQPVFVMAAPGQPLPALDAEVLRDEVRGVGPLLATGRGLRAAAEAGREWAFVCAVDMPLMTTDLIDELLGYSAHTGVDVVLPWDGRDHYLAGVYRTALADKVDALVAQGERSMGSLVGSVVAQRIVIGESKALTNVNSPADVI